MLWGKTTSYNSKKHACGVHMLPFVSGLLQVGTALLRYQRQVGGGQWPGWWPPRDEGKGGWAGTEVSFGLDFRPLPFIVWGSLTVLVSFMAGTSREGFPAWQESGSHHGQGPQRPWETSPAAHLIPMWGWVGSTSNHHGRGPDGGPDRQEPSPRVWALPPKHPFGRPPGPGFLGDQ